VLPEVVETTTTTAPTTTLTVLGAQLARTGDDAAIWLRLAGIFLIAGGVLMLAADRRVWPLVNRE
jgi:LPXTG-motif cell wall-anchored protein